MSGNTRELTLICGDHQHAVPHAEETTAGLFVHRLPEDMHPSSPHRWRTSHHSGLSVADAMTREDALYGAKQLGVLTDWRQTPDELRAVVQLGALAAVLADAFCIPPASELMPGNVSSNGTYSDADVEAAAAEFKTGGLDALQILTAMSHTVPWMGLDTDPFNEAHARIARLAGAA